jgi:hypothetical protein
MKLTSAVTVPLAQLVMVIAQVIHGPGPGSGF